MMVKVVVTGDDVKALVALFMPFSPLLMLFSLVLSVFMFPIVFFFFFPSISTSSPPPFSTLFSLLKGRPHVDVKYWRIDMQKILLRNYFL